MLRQAAKAISFCRAEERRMTELTENLREYADYIYLNFPSRPIQHNKLSPVDARHIDEVANNLSAAANEIERLTERITALETEVLKATFSDRYDDVACPITWQELAEAAEAKVYKLGREQGR